MIHFIQIMAEQNAFTLQNLTFLLLLLRKICTQFSKVRGSDIFYIQELPLYVDFLILNAIDFPEMVKSITQSRYVTFKYRFCYKLHQACLLFINRLFRSGNYAFGLVKVASFNLNFHGYTTLSLCKAFSKDLPLCFLIFWDSPDFATKSLVNIHYTRKLKLPKLLLIY